MNFLKPKKETIDEVKEYLEKRYILTMCQLEIKLYQARIDGMTSKSQRYFNSTPLSNTNTSLLSKLPIGLCQISKKYCDTPALTVNC